MRADDSLWLMEGAGNDFLVGVGSWSGRLASDPKLVIRLCRRHRGIGADGVLALDVEEDARVRLHYRNADGSHAQFCANGTRCAALAAVRLLDVPSKLVVITDWAEIPAQVDGENVTLRLPTPGPAEQTALEAIGRKWNGIVIEVGVPHLVIQVDDVAQSDFTEAAPALRRHPALGPGGANVSFVSRGPDGTVGIRTFERGVESETLSCGSAMVAAGVIEMADRDVNLARVRPASGDVLTVEDLGTGFGLTGPARFIAEVRPVEVGNLKLETRN